MSIARAVASSVLVSTLPNLVLFLVPLDVSAVRKRRDRKQPQVNILHVLLLFACGGLLGDVFIHILPELLGMHNHDKHDHQHHDHHDEPKVEHHNIFIGALVLAGFLLFFVAEMVAQSILSKNTSTLKASPKKRVTNNSKKAGASNESSRLLGSMGSVLEKVSSIGWLNIAADSMHNFTDGVALGATVGSGGSLASATFLSILIHEIPHEIGDVTILMSNGLSKWEAVKTQFITAIAALLGTLVGFYFSSNKFYEEILLSLTAGSFLYIATVGIIPVILNDSCSENTTTQIVCNALSFCVGIFLMVVVALFE